MTPSVAAPTLAECSPSTGFPRTDARRIAVQAQLLDAERPAGLLDLVRNLGLLQLDPIAAVAASADLVVWSRLGSSYSPSELRGALEDRTLLELQALIRPAEDIALYRGDMSDWPGRGELRDWQERRRDWGRSQRCLPGGTSSRGWRPRVR